MHTETQTSAPPAAKAGKGRRLSPLTRRRLAVFRSNRRAWWSLWIFGLLFGMSLFAEFLANDTPILMHYKGELYAPAVAEVFGTVYAESDFLEDGLPTEASFRDPYFMQQVAADGWMLFPPVPYSYNSIDYAVTDPAPRAPSTANWLGTDDQGRDVTARLIYGFRVSVLFGLALTLVSSVIGVFFGAVQGFFGGKVDLIGQRFVEIWSGLPTLYLLIILASVVEPNFWWLLGLMAAFSWVALVDVVRAEFLRARNFEYVKAARALGVPRYTTIFRHVLPNAMVATMTFLPFILAGSVTTLTSLDFLGFGLPPGSASLGELLAQAKNNLSAIWLALSSFFTLAIMLSLMVFIGEGVRDAFDPRKSLVATEG